MTELGRYVFRRGRASSIAGVLFAALLPALWGCSPQNGSSSDSFELQTTPATVPVVNGSNSTVEVKYVPASSLRRTVTLSVNGLPAGMQSTFSPATLDETTTSSTLTLSADANVAEGLYPISVVGASGTLSASSAVTAWVVAGLGVTFGTGASIKSPSASQYQVPFVVIAVSANGNPAPPGVLVNLTFHPTVYQEGQLAFDGTYWRPVYSIPSGCKNEDANLNGLLDPGEDYNKNGRLDPVTSASVPPAVPLDKNGSALFDITYPKAEAEWLSLQVTVMVAGPGTSESRQIFLPATSADENDGNVIPPNAVSPYGTATDCATAN